MVVATPSVSARCFYMDYKDGSEKWESMIMGPFRDYIQANYHASSDPRKNMMMMGPAMVREGALRMGFKYPDKFLAIVAQEPGIEPILHWKDMTPRMRFWRDDDLFQRAFGTPSTPRTGNRTTPGPSPKQTRSA
jgi:S-formylglutathione hydrolase